MSSRIAGYLCKAPSRVSGEASMESAEVVMAREGLLPPDGAPLLAPLLASFPTEPFGRVRPEMVGIFTELFPCPQGKIGRMGSLVQTKTTITMFQNREEGVAWRNGEE